MDKERIVVVPWSADWPEDFLRLKEVYLQHLGASVRGIEHIGSTAVPGLDAKPILDIDIVVDREASVAEIIQTLSVLGYHHLGNRGIPGREAFERLNEEVPYTRPAVTWPEHNLYVCREDSISFMNHLLLRNRMLANTEERKAYAALKLTLVSKDPYDIGAYVEGKTAFIAEILRKEGVGEEHLAEIVSQNKIGNTLSSNSGNYRIQSAHPADFPEITEVWEASVRATHDFLKEEDIQYFKPLILNEFLKEVEVYCVREGSAITAFIGLTPGTVEILFVHPEYRGRSIGKQLVTFATELRSAKRVDVNEQNLQAVGFYKKMGFRVTGRSPVDTLGKPYPLLHMELFKTQ